MDTSLLLQFVLVSVLLAWTPGADWAYVIASGMRASSPMPAVAGIVAGYLGVILLVVCGLGALVAGAPAALTTITVLGAGYLVYLGTGMVRSQPLTLTSGDGGAQPDVWSQVVKGAGISALNPKGLIVLVALLPQFASMKATWPMPMQMLTLGLINVVNIGIVYTIVGLFSKRFLSSRPGAQTIVSRFSGVVLVFIGLGLVGEHVHHML